MDFRPSKDERAALGCFEPGPCPQFVRHFPGAEGSGSIGPVRLRPIWVQAALSIRFLAVAQLTSSSVWGVETPSPAQYFRWYQQRFGKSTASFFSIECFATCIALCHCATRIK